MDQKAIIFYNKLSSDPQPDELDVLEQAALVEKALKELGYVTSQRPFSFNLEEVIEHIREVKPNLIFNLVESIENNGEFCYVAPALFNFLKVPYSGVRLEAMFNTTNKILAKEMFLAKGIPTAEWHELDDLDGLDPETRYILKPAWEEGSLGIDEHCVFQGNDVAYVSKLKDLQKGRYFVEKLIDGREFNISVLGGKKGPEVMPLAEMQFFDYPEDKPKIMGYTAKWNEESFEYEHTRRTFDYPEEDLPLRKKIEEIALNCWTRFDMKGYIRVDMRIDATGQPFVLEINTNPCLSENGGFYAASTKRGLSFKDIIERVVEDAYL